MNQYDDFTNEMLCAAIQKGNTSAQEALILRNQRWIGGLANALIDANRYKYPVDSGIVDDLIQVGNLALLKAAERYDAEQASPFFALAKTIVRRDMLNAYQSEYRKSSMHLRDTGNISAVLRLDDSYDDEEEISLSECIPDERELPPEEWFEHVEAHKSLWAALKALHPREREFIMLRYQLGSVNRQTASSGGVLPFTEAARQAHISVSRAKRLECDALAFLKRHIEERLEPTSASTPRLSPEAERAAEALLAALRQKAAGKCLHVGNIPFFACSGDHSEVITGRADMVIIPHISFMGKQAKRSAYVPKWLITGDPRAVLRLNLDFPDARAMLHLRIEAPIGRHALPDTEELPDLVDWLWFLASELWKDKRADGDELADIHARSCLVRDICDVVLEQHRRLGG